MSVGSAIAGFFAVAFTLGALVLPYVMRKWIETQQSPWRRLGGAMYALFGTMGLAVLAVSSTAFLCGYLEATPSTFWYAVLGQGITIGGNLFFWFSREVRAPY